MKTIWKYEFEVSDMIRLEIPGGGEILKFQLQNGKLCMWILVETEKPKKLRIFVIYGTGQTITVNINTEYQYIDTVLQSDGKLVWHLFEYVGIEKHLKNLF